MTQISEQINQFREFALSRLSSGKQDVSIDELYDEWRMLNPDSEKSEADAKAVSASLNDYHRGIKGKSAEDVIRNLTSKLPNE
ncbi:MAG TPA: hypothetical protein PKD64_15420 [Pirellulaceae bacterium]|nr:hypothetical protein [Pirellulaceae bacterium]HMO93575.1 hypothetical protein [Pirellulaceae bacterium]HMP71588.1 hypothetical protein [Pirellulaceae bacterium]